MKAIGIDLGTTNSVAAVTGREGSRVLANREGSSLTRSVVSYVKRRGSNAGEIVAGRAAANNAARDPINTIFSVKRLMGRQYGEKRVEEVQRRYGLQLAPPPPPDSEDQGVRVLLNSTPYTPSEISSMILKQVKADAELALGEEVTHAVITVPAYFEERQRKATADAGRLAGLEVLGILDEPTAAALAYGFGKEDQRHRLLVYDLGGGTFDISIIQMTRHNYSVLETQGDNWLGGDDFDQMIVHRMIGWTKDEFSYDASANLGFLIKAKDEAESAKKALSTQLRTEILLPFNVPNVGMIDIDMELARETFEDDIREKLEDTVELVRRALDNQSLTPDDITAVLLVGGSTAIPLVHRLLADIFGERKLKRDINPMECVALGAGLYTDRFELRTTGEAAPKPDPKGSIQHVTPMHLGIAAVKDEDGDFFQKIIEKGTPYPLDKPKTCIVYPTDPKLIRLPVYEGLSPQASLNEQQALLEFPLPPGANLSTPIDIAFDYDRNRVLTVRVKIADLAWERGDILQHYRPRPKPARPQNADKIKDDWREVISTAIRRGNLFLQSCGMYMTENDRTELQDALQQAQEALKAGDETAAKRAALTIDNKRSASGLASMINIAESWMPNAPAKYGPTLARAIAQLRQAHAQKQEAQTEKLMQTVRAVLAEMVNARSIGDVAGKNFDALVRVLDEMKT